MPRKSHVLTLVLAEFLIAVSPVAAHGAGGTRQSFRLPGWVLVIVGGGVIMISFILASMMTDREFIEAFHNYRRNIDVNPLVFRAAGLFLKVFGLLFGVAVLYTGMTGGLYPNNFSLLAVWGVWWVGYTATVYLLGDSWRYLNPWRTVSEPLPDLDLELNVYVKTAASVGGILGLVWLEVGSSAGASGGNPRVLSYYIIGYSVLTVMGAVIYGTSTWFGHVDPLSRMFRIYGWIAPVSRTDEGLEFSFPSSRLVEPRYVDDSVDVGFVAALLWAASFDGFTATPLWNSGADFLREMGVPRSASLLVTLIGGFLFFLGIYRLASVYSHRTADSLIHPRWLEIRFVSSLVPIAAGYHLAHYLGYLFNLAPSIADSFVHPFGTPGGLTVAVLPDWYTALPVVFIFLGHVAAIWVSHAISFDVFTGRLQPIKSQYPYVVAMVFYTMFGLWTIT